MIKLSIGQLAKYTEIRVATIRYYGKCGLITKPFRQKSGYRKFEQKHIGEIAFIKQAKELGFALKDISKLRAFVREKDAKRKVHKFIETKIEDCEDIISDLKSKKKLLQNMLKKCSEMEYVCTCKLFSPIKSFIDQDQ